MLSSVTSREQSVLQKRDIQVSYRPHTQAIIRFYLSDEGPNIANDERNTKKTNVYSQTASQNVVRPITL